MEQHYQQLRDVLEELQGLSYIDEDTGQLEAMLNGEDTYPITFPAALVNFGDILWENVKNDGTQKGKGLVTIRIAFDCYDDSHYGAGQDEYGAQRREFVGRVHKAIHGLRAVVTGRPYLRTASHAYALPGRIKVYELDYSYTTEE